MANRKKVRDIYVARTVPDQEPLDTFLKDMGRHLGRSASIKSITSTHVTFLESYGVKQKLAAYGYTPGDVIGFTRGLQRCLDTGGHRTQITAEPDLGSPLKWMSYRPTVRILAVNLLKSEQLLDQRGRIENYLVGQFGVLPTIRKFSPHITIGAVYKWYLNAEPDTCDFPELLMPGYAVVPSEISLNGLEVYIDRIAHPLGNSAGNGRAISAVSSVIPLPAVPLSEV